MSLIRGLIKKLIESECPSTPLPASAKLASIRWVATSARLVTAV